MYSARDTWGPNESGPRGAEARVPDMSEQPAPSHEPDGVGAHVSVGLHNHVCPSPQGSRRSDLCPSGNPEDSDLMLLLRGTALIPEHPPGANQKCGQAVQICLEIKAVLGVFPNLSLLGSKPGATSAKPGIWWHVQTEGSTPGCGWDISGESACPAGHGRPPAAQRQQKTLNSNRGATWPSPVAPAAPRIECQLRGVAEGSSPESGLMLGISVIHDSDSKHVSGMCCSQHSPQISWGSTSRGLSGR